jgi:ribose transport system permease protein
MTESNPDVPRVTDGPADGVATLVDRDARGAKVRRRVLTPSVLLPVSRRYGILVAWGIVVLIFAFLEPGIYFTYSNAAGILSNQAPLLILSLALLIPLVVGEFDLSVAGTLGLSFVLCPYLVVVKHVPLGVVVAICMFSGVGVGVVNALIVVRIGITSIVVTLGTGTVLYGLGFMILQAPLGGMDNSLSKVMGGNLGSIAVPFFVALSLTIICWFILSYRPIGRMLYLTGMNQEAARLAGARVNLLRGWAFVVSGLIAAGGGVVLAGLDGGGDPSTATSLLLPVFATVFLGGAAITPGRVNALGTLIATYFLASGVTGLEIYGLTGWVQQVFYGSALIVGVIVAGVRTL